MRESIHPGGSRGNRALEYPLDARELERRGKVVAFLPLSEYGHLIPTLKLASRMRDDGWRVVYLAERPFHGFLEARGFECRAPEPTAQERAAMREDCNSVPRFEAYARARREILQELRPSLVMGDNFASIDTLPAVEMGIRVAIYTVIIDAETKRFRPMVRAYPNPEGARDRLRMRMDWLRVIYLRNSRRFLARPDELRVQIHARRRMRAVGLRAPAFSFPGFCYWIDPLVLGPRALAFGALASDRYFGYCVGESFGANDAELERFARRPGKRVYLSFGSLSGRYPLAKDIARRIARCLGEHSGYSLVAQAGAFASELQALERDNVAVRARVDQASLLRSMDVAIIHGGYGSFKECVVAGAPFIVCPFLFDQPSNARRAVELGIGDFIEPERFGEARFLAMLDRLAGDASARARVARLYDAERDEREFEAAYGAFMGRLGLARDRRGSRMASG